MKIFVSTLILAAILGSATASYAADLVSDGDFSNPPGGSMFVTYGAGKAMGPWTVIQGSVDLNGGYWQGPPDGGGSVDLDGFYQAGGVSQSLNLAAGSYILQFYLAGNPDGQDAAKAYLLNWYKGDTSAVTPVKTVEVAVGDASQTFNFDVTGASRDAMGYVLESLQFTTTGPTTLSFTSLDKPTSAFGAVIGDVSVTPDTGVGPNFEGGVPEPSTWTMLLLGVSLIGAAARRDRRRPAMAAAAIRPRRRPPTGPN